jgi:hypothetical protein
MVNICHFLQLFLHKPTMILIKCQSQSALFAKCHDVHAHCNVAHGHRARAAQGSGARNKAVRGGRTVSSTQQNVQNTGSCQEPEHDV